MQNREPEQAIIGAVLRKPELYQSLRDVIRPEDFGWVSYGSVWKSFESLYQNGLAIDTVTVGDELERSGSLGEVQTDDGQWNGRSALSSIREQGRPSSAMSYAEQILDYKAKRDLMEIFSSGANWSANGRRAKDIISDITSKMKSVRVLDARSDSVMTLKEAISAAYDDTDAAGRGEVRCVPTGFIDLDKLLGGGLTAPDVMIVAARPGQGKTTLLANIAFNVAKMGKRVAFFTLEMGNKQVAMRFISMESGVDYQSQRRGKMRDEEWPLYVHAIESLAELPVILCDMGAITISGMRQKLREMGDVDLICFDYIQIGGSERKHNTREQEVAEISSGLKAIAKEFNIPIIGAAQLSRELEKRQEKRPVLSDLRESGSIENDADIVTFIYRPDQYEKATAKQNVAEIIIAKHRNGPVGSIELIYRSAITKFENATTRRVDFKE